LKTKENEMKYYIISMMMVITVLMASDYTKWFENGEYAKIKKSLETESKENRLYWEGKISFAEGDFDKSTDSFSDLVDLVPDNSNYQFEKAKAYMELMKNASMFSIPVYASKAKSSLIKSVELDSRNIEARIYLAMYYMNAPAIGGGDKEEGLKHKTAEVTKGG